MTFETIRNISGAKERIVVAKLMSKAEQAFKEQFKGVADRLPGNAAVRRAREAALEQFSSQGLPHRHIEEWKYTDLRTLIKDALPLSVADATAITIADVIVALGPLAKVDAQRVVLVNGAYRAELSTVDLQPGLIVTPLADELANGPVDGLELAADNENSAFNGNGALSEDSVISLNAAYMTDGALIKIDPDASITKPIMVVHVRAGRDAGLVAARHVIDVGENTTATIVEAFVALPGAVAQGQVNTVSHVNVGKNAHLDHLKCAVDQGSVVHLANWIARLGADSKYHCYQHTQGVGLARNQLFVTFDGEGGDLDISGSFLSRNSEHVDTTLVVDHAVPSCASRELFKGVLDGSSRGIFQGKVVVRQIAQKTDGKQMAQALMLSPDAEFDSKPELEIYADDVACGHGSTSAELDEDLIFYCRARGIPEEQARALLIQSFIGEAIDKVESDELRAAIQVFAADWLEQQTA